MYYHMNEQGSFASRRPAVVHSLAVVGFIALIGSGMWLAIYSTRYVPSVVTRLGSAAVYLGSVFNRAPDSDKRYDHTKCAHRSS